MASSSPKTKEEENKSVYDAYRDVVSKFPTGRRWTFPVYKHPKHTWYGSLDIVVSAMVAEKHFEARPSDVIVTSFPKSGTTWTIALLVATMNRRHSDIRNLAPHDYAPSLETSIYVDDQIPDLTALPSPRLFSTHMTYSFLPNSVLESACRIIYVWRDPKDVFVSLFHFVSEIARARNHPSPLVSVEVAFDMFCEGFTYGGPCWDHVLGYWKAGLANNNVLFLRYEDMKKDPQIHVKRIAEFVGKPFSDAEEKQGVVEDVIKLCSFDSLRNMEVNKTGRTTSGLDNASFYRKGSVGDWANHFTPRMKERIDRITREKFQGSGISF